MTQGHSGVEENSNVPPVADLPCVVVNDILLLSIVLSLYLLCVDWIRFEIRIEVFDQLEFGVGLRAACHGIREHWPHSIHLAHELSFVASTLVLHGRIEDPCQALVVLSATYDVVSSVEPSVGDSIEITSSPLCHCIPIVVRWAEGVIAINNALDVAYNSM